MTITTRRSLACFALLISLPWAGCSSEVLTEPTIRLASAEQTGVLREGISIPASRVWTDTGIDVRPGQAIEVTASGEVRAFAPSRYDTRSQHLVGPEGTYLFSQDTSALEFPLPAAGHGPAPCFCLIGRIGEGEPFFVGRRQSWVCREGGRLWLGVNDGDVSDNSGKFLASVQRAGEVAPVSYEEYVAPLVSGGGNPAAGSSVVVFYVDGLRPDVVQEMAAMGHIPHIKETFIDGGAWLANTTTVFPSDTITSNGTMWTGCFSDRHGLKGQVRFSRRKLVSESYLDPLGPSRSARLLSPQGLDKAALHTQAATISMFKGREAGRQWLETQTTEVPPLYEHLRNAGHDWATGILPMMTEMPPDLWTRSLTRHLPYFQSHNAWQQIDEANATYAVRHLLLKREPVTIIWLPETDSCSHKCQRGQFGVGRRTIAVADRLLGDVVQELTSQQRLESTYLVLVSDHGHVGGRDSHLMNYDLAQECFFAPREVDDSDRWVGGGLGLSVRMHRMHDQHRGDSSREFVFIDGEADGAARLFLPRGHYRSKDWSGPNDAADLLAYRLDESRSPVNLPRWLAGLHGRDDAGASRPIVDLVLMKLDRNSILITTSDRHQAVIDRRLADDGEWEYRYRVVTAAQRTGEGTVSYRPIAYPQVDPLGLLRVLPADRLSEYRSEDNWLRITAHTDYPDGVVALTRHMLWQERLKYREREFAPDLVVTARPGWYFGKDSSPGTMHGYPLSDAMRATLFVSGPRVRQGARIADPARLADLTPTILEMAGIPVKPSEFDGRPLRTIYEGEAPLKLVPNDPELQPVAFRDRQPRRPIFTRPVYWQDVDLQAWRPLSYEPGEPRRERPFTVNRPTSPWDLNNVVYNVTSLGDLAVLRVFDDVISPLAGDRQYVVGSVEMGERYVRRRPQRWLAELPQVLELAAIAPSDYSFTSQGNLQRVDRLIDWSQARGMEADARLAGLVERSTLPGTKQVHAGIDLTQDVFWETYRFGQRIVVQVMDETLINSLEDGTDRLINLRRRPPSEVPPR